MDALEHFRWARTRALEYCDMGDGSGALGSLVSDLNKHERTQHIMRNLQELAMGLLILDLQRGRNGGEEMRKFIDGIPEPTP